MKTLPGEVRTAVAELAALLETDPARALTLAPAPAHPTVTVVGTPGSGVTSLVNAVLHTPGLVADGTAPTRVARAPGPPMAGLTDLPADVPLLRNLSLVDSAGRSTGAWPTTAVLVALDAAAPVGDGGLELIRRWSAEVETVLFTLTKIDRYRDWRDVLDADRALLTAAVPRLCRSRILPVSARLAAAAITTTEEEPARMLREGSGVAAVQEHVQQAVTGRVVMLAQVNQLRALHSALVTGARAAREEATALPAGGAGSAGLRSRRAELVEARRSGLRAATLRLRHAVARARVESAHEVTAALRECQGRFRVAVDAADAAALKTLPARLEPALADLADRVSGSVDARLAQVGELVMAEVTDAESYAAGEFGGSPCAAPAPPRPALVIRAIQPRVGGPGDKVLVLAGASGGVGLGKLALTPLALVPGVGVVVLPLTLALGAGAAWWMTRTRAHAADRAHLLQWASDVLAEARSTLDQLVAARLIDIEQSLATALDDVAARRAARIDAELRDVDTTVRLEAADRARRARACELREEQLDAGAARAHALLQRVSAVR